MDYPAECNSQAYQSLIMMSLKDIITKYLDTFNVTHVEGNQARGNMGLNLSKLKIDSNINTISQTNPGMW